MLMHDRHPPSFTRILVLIGLLALATVPVAQAQGPITAWRCDIELMANDLPSDFDLTSFYTLPGDTVDVRGVRPGNDWWTLIATDGKAVRIDSTHWKWVAPNTPGVYEAALFCDGGLDRMAINFFVMVPASKIKQGKLNGYRIGDYPRRGLKGLTAYLPPKGFVEVTKENADTRVSRHFTLRQFLCKQASDWPKYVVLDRRLIQNLEIIVEVLNDAGVETETLHIMSGYRTPFYNKAIGNVKYSRHVYGGAADVFVDNDGDNRMDDLNGDGKVNLKDAGWLFDLVDGLYAEEWYQPYVGGLAKYRTTSAHGPFVHVDVRGFRARWGL